MPLEDLSGMTVLGKSTEAYLAERAEEEKRQADVWQRLQTLQQLQQDFEAVRRRHYELTNDLREFGRALGLLQVETVDEMMKEPQDAA